MADAGAPADATVDGRIVIAPEVPALEGAVVHVRLEEVSAADAASILVAEAVIPEVHHPAGVHGTVVPFTLRGGHMLDPRADYAIRVWVDGDGSGVPGPGDLHGDERYPVLTRGFGRSVEIVLGARHRRAPEREGQR